MTFNHNNYFERSFNLRPFFLILNIFFLFGLQLQVQVAKAAGGSSSGNGGIAKGAAAITTGINMVAGASYAAQCATQPPNIPACVMAALSFAQAKEDGKAKKAASTTQAGYQSNGGGAYDEFNSPDGAYAPFKEDFEKLGIKDEAGIYKYSDLRLAELKKMGVKINDKEGTITGPDGKTFSMSAFSSAKSMEDAGISKEEIAELGKIAKAVSDKYKVSAVGIASGGGGGGYSGSSSAASNREPFDFFGDREKPQAARTAGLSRTLASGESIGTQTDSIFEMISRRYQKKNAENIFVGPDGKANNDQ